MKIIYQILILVFVTTSFYILRDDFSLVTKNIFLYFNKNSENQIIKSIDKKEIKSSGEINVPGALRVASDFIDGNDKVILSKDKVILSTNEYRKNNGNLTVLKENEKLNLSAEKKLRDMFANQYFEHISPSGSGVGDLGQEVGYEYILIGENLALGNFKNDISLVEAWMASPGHRANILNEHYTEIGVAVGKGNFEGKEIWLAVQHFGTPRSICPSVDEVLYSQINTNQSEIKKLEDHLSRRQEIMKNRGLYEGSTYAEQVYKYNNLVAIYNKLITDTKQKIDEYNTEIKSFNTCLLDNQ